MTLVVVFWRMRMHVPSAKRSEAERRIEKKIKMRLKDSMVEYNYFSHISVVLKIFLLITLFPSVRIFAYMTELYLVWAQLYGEKIPINQIYVALISIKITFTCHGYFIIKKPFYLQLF